MDSERIKPLELRIIYLVAEGKTDKQIGEVLNIKENTVGTYLREIYAKVGVTKRTELVNRFFDLHLKEEFNHILPLK